MPTANLSSSYTGISNIDSIPAEIRLYGRTSDVLRLTRGRNSMMRVMYDNFLRGGKIAETDMEFKYKSELPLNFVVPVSVASSNKYATHDMFSVPVAMSNLVRVGSLLVVRGIYIGTDGTNYTYETTMGTNNATQLEMIQVLQKLPSDGTNVPIIVSRCYHPSILTSSGSVPGAGTPIQITTSMKLIITSTPQAEGNNEGDAWGDNPDEEFNYNEINLGKWGQTRLSKNIKRLQDEGIMERNGRRQLELYWQELEWRQIFGRRATGLNERNQRWWTTGGLDEYIETPQPLVGYYPNVEGSEGKHIINWGVDIGAINFQNLNTFGANKFTYGSMEKWWVMDNLQYTAIVNSFDNKIRINYNEGLSTRYGFKISDIEISGGGVFHLVQSDGFALAGLSDLSYIVDFPYFKHTHLQNEDFTIMVDVEKGLNPLQQINYFYMNSGIKRYNPRAHYKVYNMIGS